MNIDGLPHDRLFARTESPALGLHHNPDFSSVYRRGMASQARGDVNLDDWVIDRPRIPAEAQAAIKSPTKGFCR
jgi:hypothetical protein